MAAAPLARPFRDGLLGPLQGRGSGDAAAEEIAPWWPFPPGALAQRSDAPASPSNLLVDPDPPDAVLDQFEELDVVVRDVPFRDVIRAAYDNLLAPGDEGSVETTGT